MGAYYTPPPAVEKRIEQQGDFIWKENKLAISSLGVAIPTPHGSTILGAFDKYVVLTRPLSVPFHVGYYY